MRTRIHTSGVRRNNLDATDHASEETARRLRRGAAAVALTAALGLTLAACGDGSDSAGSPSATQTASNGDVFNNADVAFATDMVQHHSQALAMVDMTVGRPLDPAVKKLTDQIRQAQAPEIETMAGWLTDWGQKVPATVNDHVHGRHEDSRDPRDSGDSGGMGGMDMGDDESGMDDTGGDMPGMMSAEDMDKLENASDAEFQDMWLQMMEEHHRGAISMAQDEIDNGTFDDAIAMAKSIVSSQQAEIDKMDKLLG
jgi:uncharacterized protein (DUF305 family)